jgi:serine/threonine-protein kinase SRPK3
MRVLHNVLRRSYRIQWVNGVERLELYQPGGYHPLLIDDLLDHSRYRITDKLGFGGYSTIWLARDEQLNRYVAVKINISDHPRSRSVCHVLRKLASKREAADLLPTILDDFEI